MKDRAGSDLEWHLNRVGVAVMGDCTEAAHQRWSRTLNGALAAKACIQTHAEWLLQPCLLRYCSLLGQGCWCWEGVSAYLEGLDMTSGLLIQQLDNRPFPRPQEGGVGHWVEKPQFIPCSGSRPSISNPTFY